MKNIDYSAVSFVGRRDNNQDACVVEEIENDIQFIAVADGMGGVTGGQIASKLVLNNCLTLLKNEFKQQPEIKDLKKLLEKAFITSQQAIRKRIENEPVLSGMGTTLTAILIWGNYYVWGNLGDSRIYKLCNDNIKQITKDHTYIEDYKIEHEGEVPKYIIDQYSHYLTKSMDGGSDTPDIFPIDKDYEELEDNSIFLLCSDGLITNKVEDNFSILSDYMTGLPSLKKSVRNLICDAYYHGSSDNITVVLVENGKHKRKNVKVKTYLYPPSDKKLHKIFDSPMVLTYTIFTIAIILVLLIVILL